MPERIPQSATIRVPLQVFLSADHVTPGTGLTIPITISKNGAAYGNPSGGATNAVEIGNGSYYVDLSTTDTGTVGPLFVLGILSGMDNVVAIYNVVDYVGPIFDQANTVEGYTFRQALRLFGAAIAGLVTGGPGSPVYQSMGGSTTRISATADSSGNRSAVTLTP
jgi:hypothetical protein